MDSLRIMQIFPTRLKMISNRLNHPIHRRGAILRARASPTWQVRLLYVAFSHSPRRERARGTDAKTAVEGGRSIYEADRARASD